MSLLWGIFMKKWLLNKVLQHLFPVFKIENVLTASRSGHLFLNGELITEKRKNSLQAQVRMLRNTELWEIMTDTLKYEAQLTMFNNSKDLQDLMNGKMICYTIGVQENIIKKIEEAR